MVAGFIASRIVVLALVCAVPAVAADVIPLTAAQKKNLGVATV